MALRNFSIFLLIPWAVFAQQGQGLEDKILERGDKLLEEAKSAYEDARSRSSGAAFIDAGFKLEEARIKFIVLQEIGSPEKQKIATDRLRSINQLGKLIHDGKVAVSGSPAEPAASTPRESPAVPPSSDPGAKPDPKPAKAPPAIMVRKPIPEAAKQRDAEKQIKEIFKEKYAKKAPADRQDLEKALLDQAAKTPDDPVAQWVLYREAQDVATQICDVKTLEFAIDAASETFDIDALSAKHAAFLAAGKNAKTPGESAALAEALLFLVDELIGIDQYDAADKATTAALQLSKRANEPTLTARATLCTKETAEAKTKFQAMKSALETLAKTPEDPGANSQMGQFLCFVKGNWDLGLRFIVKGGDLPLKALGEKEIALPTQATERAALGDGWWDLADKEKSPLCRRQLFTHSKEIYESCLTDSTGLVRAKIEKRLEALQTMGVLKPQAFVDATTLTPTKATVGAFVLGVNTNANNLAVFVQGKECKQYLFAHAPSSIFYDIPPRTKSFTAIGTKLDKKASHVTGTWKYMVIVDGKLLHESKPLNEFKSDEVQISVAIPLGAREIELRVNDLGDKGSDWSVWAFPRFLK